MANFFYKHVKKMENVNFILKFIPSSYIKNLLDIVVKLKIKKYWPYHHAVIRETCIPVVSCHRYRNSTPIVEPPFQIRSTVCHTQVDLLMSIRQCVCVPEVQHFWTGFNYRYVYRWYH